MGWRLLLLILGCCFFQSAVAASSQQFVTVADLHFNPFLTCKEKRCELINALEQAQISDWPALFSRLDHSSIQYKKDASYPLLISLMNALKKETAESHIKFVLVLGDFISHNFKQQYKKYALHKSRADYEIFVKKTLAFITTEFAKTFPHTDIYYVIGNNDSYQDDYVQDPEGQLFKDMSSLNASLIHEPQHRALLSEQFHRAGFYTIDIEPQLELVVLNSVLFSSQAKGKNIDAIAEAQLSWFHQQLENAARHHKHVLIAMHIPMGVDVYSSLFNPFRIIEFWKSTYAKTFLEDVDHYSPQILGVFTGHLHADVFQIYRAKLGTVPFTGTPSISPIFGNNPAFKIYTYSAKTSQLMDFTTYYYDLSGNQKWEKEYDFDEVYRLKQSQGATLVHEMDQFQPEGHLAEKYKTYYSVKSDSQPITKYKAWRHYWCAIYGLTVEKYKACLYGK